MAAETAARRVITPGSAPDGARTVAIAEAPPDPALPRDCVRGPTVAPEADIRRTIPFAVAFADATRTVAVTEPPGRIVAADTVSPRDSTGVLGLPGPVGGLVGG
ncbi:hypothetical protein [Actinomadura luteofluorescens]